MTKSELIHSYISCTCDGAYKIRDLADPNCCLCNYEEEISDIMTIYANSQLVEFVNWINESKETMSYIKNSRIGQFNLNRDEKF